MTTHIMSQHLHFASQLARQAGELLLSHFKLSGSQTTLKPDRTVVTEADFEADRFIAETIREHYPGEALVSEELQPSLDETGKAVWVIDPLDGTTNFSLGLQIWGVSIARLVDGRPSTGVVYFPTLNELYTAEAGMGAGLNGEPIQVRPPVPGQPTAFFSCCSRTHRRYDVNVRYKTRILGSAAYTFCAVARGMAILGFEATPKIWDISAGWLVVQEAQGLVETLDGSLPFPLIPGFDYRTRDFPTISAATPELLAQAREQIRPRAPK
ncbi:MAG TPA: inositol monophosphatase family protein [Anaerolineales bacterium]